MFSISIDTIYRPKLACCVFGSFTIEIVRHFEILNGSRYISPLISSVPIFIHLAKTIPSPIVAYFSCFFEPITRLTVFLSVSKHFSEFDHRTPITFSCSRFKQLLCLSFILLIRFLVLVNSIACYHFLNSEYILLSDSFPEGCSYPHKLYRPFQKIFRRIIYSPHFRKHITRLCTLLPPFFCFFLIDGNMIPMLVILPEDIHCAPVARLGKLLKEGECLLVLKGEI